MLADTVQYQDTSVHLVYQQYVPSGTGLSHLRLIDVGASYDPGRWFVTGDSNYTEDTFFGDFLAWYASAGVRFDRFAPYAFYSTTRQQSKGASGLSSQGDEHTLAGGVRWDFRHNFDFKLQFERVIIDDPQDPAAFSFLEPAARIGDHADILSLGLDFVF